MNTVNEDHYFPMMNMSNEPGPAITQDCDSKQIGLGLHAGSQEEPFPSFVPGDLSALRVPDQMEDRRSYYAQSVCTQPSLGHESQRPPSVTDNAEDCLNFLPPVAPYTLLDEWSQPVDILLSAQLAGLFSRETQVLEGTMPDEHTSIAPESMNLICYRRNLISITGHVAIPAKLRLVENAQGQQVPIISQEIVLSVFESLERGRGGRLIQSLRSGPPISAAAEADSDSPGPEPISLDPEKAEDGSQDQEYVIFPFEWQRLQFRKATPNNGKSRDRQKYFFVSIKILAHLADGQKVSISEASSNPIVVRGRGPQNFVAKDSQKIGRSRSLNSTNEGRLKKPNRHATRNSLLRQSLSRKARADSTTGSSDALQRMSIEDLSALFQDTTAADVRPFNPSHSPLNDMDMDRTGRRHSPPSAALQAGQFSYLRSPRSASIPPTFDMHVNGDFMFSPEGFSDTSASGFPHVSSVSPQDLEKKHDLHFGRPLSPPRSEGFRSSSLGTEQRFRSPLESASSGFTSDTTPSITRNESQTNIFHTLKGEGEMNMPQQFPMSPPEDDFVKTSASVAASNASVQDHTSPSENRTRFPMTPMSPPKDSESGKGLNKPPTSAAVDSEKTTTLSVPSSMNHNDTLPSPRTQMEIFDRIMTPFPPYQGVDSWQVSDIMTPITEQAEPRALPDLTEQAQTQMIPAISEPTEPQHILSFAEQLCARTNITSAEGIEIISIPPPTEQMDADILPSTEIYTTN